MELKMRKKKTSTASDQSTGSDSTKLDSRYGAIGIPALAAALEFKGDAGKGAPGQSEEERAAEPAG
jgi:hypothetical protein